MMLYHVAKLPYQFCVFGEEDSAVAVANNNTSSASSLDPQQQQQTLQQQPRRKNRKLLVNCLDPRIGWADFKSNNPHHVLLMSGTLGDPRVMTTELGENFVDVAGVPRTNHEFPNNNNSYRNDPPPPPNYKHISQFFLKTHDSSPESTADTNLEKKHVQVMDEDFPAENNNEKLIKAHGFANFSLPSISSLEGAIKYNHSIRQLAHANVFVGKHVIDPR